ncbi:MAG: DUF6898 family protein [Alphaproteobacteria bacterium]
MGRYGKVSAVDTKTSAEVSIVGDPAQGETIMKWTVIRKLQYGMNKNKNT